MKSVTFGNKTIVRSAVLALAAFGAMGAAQAATATTTFRVKLTVTESCSITAAPAVDVSFASQARTASALTLDATGTLTVNCTPGTTYNIGLNGGLNSTGTATTPVVGDRRMAFGTSFVGYELYQNAGRSTFWGNTVGTNTLAGTGTGSNVAVSVYGRVVSANVIAGAYEDTVTATITY